MNYDPEAPWLPADAGEEFDPLAHAGVEPSEETPMVFTPRGGAREVGRSCYQLDTRFSTYLVDCGLNQGSGDKWPDTRGLSPECIDAVFLTHAHIDHSGGLPVFEARGYFDDDAPIVATPPTIELAKLLLKDSLKIHRHVSDARGEEQAFTERDVERVFDRFEPVGYGGGRVAGVADVPETESLVFQFGNAAHLLGSAWLSLQAGGRRAVFSGDLGGRASHLPDIATPPQADFLVCESTYGSTHSHKSMDDGQTDLYRIVERAVEQHEPVLIPSFAVGRSQLIQLLFADRLHTLPGDLREKVQLVVDGMAQEATEIYHEFVRDDEYFDDSIVNRVVESGLDEPFLPNGAVFPESDADRREILENTDPQNGGKVPIIISPSGMLSGGNSPRYLAEFAARYPSAKLVLTGYQAVGTPGRTLQNYLKAGEEELTIETDANPFGTDWPEDERVAWTTVENEDGSGHRRVTRVRLPAEWVETVHGLSGHAAQPGLRGFARDVSAPTVTLVHGPDHAQDHLARDFAENVDSVEEVTRARLLTPIGVSRDIEIDTPSITAERLKSNSPDLRDQVEHLTETVSSLSEDLAALQAGANLSESDVREIVRETVREELAGEED
jgi:metallo-beta-lactamase family protein